MKQTGARQQEPQTTIEAATAPMISVRVPVLAAVDDIPLHFASGGPQ